jgi:hypothetical protein
MDWVLNFTQGATRDKERLAEQALRLLQTGLWGIPESTQAKDKLAAGDRVLISVGAPDRAFVGDAVIAVGWHPWAPDELEAYRKIGSAKAGLRLTAGRSWTTPLFLDAVWHRTEAARTNPSAQWFGAAVRLTPADFDVILKAGVGASDLPIDGFLGAAEDLVGRDAWIWLKRRARLGAHLLDFSLTELPVVFGVERRAGAFVPIDLSRGKRWDFFLAIQGQPDRVSDWEQLVTFHEHLIRYIDGFQASGRRRPAQRFHPVLLEHPPGAVSVRDAAKHWLART